MTKKIVVAMILSIMVFGCSPWSVVGGPYSESAGNFDVTLPAEWKKWKEVKDFLVITHDGLSLNQIRIERKQLGKPLLNTKKMLVKGMIPQEAAEVIIEDLMANLQITGQQIIENSPEMIDGQQGFKIVAQYQNEEGLKKKTIAYGFMNNSSAYILSYLAPARHYFDKNYADFEKVKESFHLNNPEK